ncbi:hypothetical protein F4680DRAFT_302011 [Xylaria scruposa]|nr:hypothetical protein F4680DRAFT_302011 [Xylaria scruposa]
MPPETICCPHVLLPRVIRQYTGNPGAASLAFCMTLHVPASLYVTTRNVTDCTDQLLGVPLQCVSRASLSSKVTLRAPERLSTSVIFPEARVIDYPHACILLLGALSLGQLAEPWPSPRTVFVCRHPPAITDMNSFLVYILISEKMLISTKKVVFLYAQTAQALSLGLPSKTHDPWTWVLGMRLGLQNSALVSDTFSTSRQNRAAR